MPAQEIQFIINYLDQQAEELGMKEVREAAKKFLLRKSLAEGATKRKPIPKAWIEKAFVRQRGVCPRCEELMYFGHFVGDHRIALALGGRHTRSNIVAMHPECNASKGANDLAKESKLTGQTIMEQLQK